MSHIDPPDVSPESVVKVIDEELLELQARSIWSSPELSLVAPELAAACSVLS